MADGQRSVRLDSSSFARGLEVLAALADHGPMRADVIAARTGMPASTVYRYIRSLVAFGFLESRDGVYAPGERLAQLTRVSTWTDQLLRLGAPILQNLAALSGETAMLTVRVGHSAQVIDRVESPQAMRLSFQPGSLHPIYAGASAKVLLAYAPAAVVEDVVAHGLTPLTPSTPDEDKLRRQLAAIRGNGYSVTHAEADMHAVAVAVPVFRDNTCICGLSIAGPAYRFEPARAHQLISLVRKEGRQLSDALTELANAGRSHDRIAGS